MSRLLDVTDLKVHFITESGAVAKAVDGISFSVGAGRTLGVVGESGCGKSVTSRAILRLIEMPGWIRSGKIQFESREGSVDLAGLSARGKRMRAIRGKDIALIFQEPMTALNPVFTVGRQTSEALLLHEKVSKAEARERAVAALAAVGIPAPERRYDDYPHQLSGGMRQRVMIAMALVCQPSLLIADEPTTALDVTIQAQVLDLMSTLRRDFSGGTMFITHDLGVIASMADDVIVMYRGKIVESAPAREMFHKPLHPYTEGLLRSVPSLTKRSAGRLETIEGTVPAPTERIVGCNFADRCTHVMARCRRAAPALTDVGGGHATACFLHHSIEDENADAA